MTAAAHPDPVAQFPGDAKWLADVYELVHGRRPRAPRPDNPTRRAAAEAKRARRRARNLRELAPRG